MPTSTTQAIWRSGGGDTTKTAYAGSMLMVAEFYFSATATANSLVAKSSTNSAPVILPVGAEILEIQANAAGTGGTNPTFDMGTRLYVSGTNAAGSLINEGDADAGKQVFNWASATAGTALGGVMSTSEMVYITGSVGASAATGGAVSGTIIYCVPTDGAYTA
jgi:hypothetical protein